MTTALDTWLKETGTPALHLARAVGISAPYVHDLRFGKRSPSVAVMAKIEEFTGGKVTPSIWVKS